MSLTFSLDSLALLFGVDVLPLGVDDSPLGVAVLVIALLLETDDCKSGVLIPASYARFGGCRITRGLEELLDIVCIG